MSPASEEKRTLFISRTGVDKDWAQWIAQELEAAGHSAIVQDWDSRPGKSFVDFMRRGAEHETILVMSPEYWKAVYTQPEWEAAFLSDVIIPVRVRECIIPKLVKRLVFIDLVGKNRDEARQELLEGIKRERLGPKVTMRAPAERPRTFISYSREDMQFALRLAKDLRNAGANIWIDCFDIPVGQNRPRAVEQALDECGQFMVILSLASVRSENVMAELNFAIGEKKRIFPVLYRDCKRPFRIRDTHYADFTSEYQTGFGGLVKGLEINKAL